MTFRHSHPRSRNDRGDYRRQADTMSARRLVCLRHDTANLLVAEPFVEARSSMRPLADATETAHSGSCIGGGPSPSRGSSPVPPHSRQGIIGSSGSLPLPPHLRQVILSDPTPYPGARRSRSRSVSIPPRDFNNVEV